MIRRTVRHLSASRDLHLHGQHGCRAEQRPPRAKLWTYGGPAGRAPSSPGSRVCKGSDPLRALPAGGLVQMHVVGLSKSAAGSSQLAALLEQPNTGID